MQFVLPFTKSRSQSGNLPIVSFESDQNVEDDESTVDEPDEVSKTEDLEVPVTPYTPDSPHEPSEQLNKSGGSSRMSASTGKFSAKRKIPTKYDDVPYDDEMKKAVVGYLYKRTTMKSENPDLDFFKSILPDLVTFTPSQKRRFKVKVLQILEEISNEDVNSTYPVHTFDF